MEGKLRCSCCHRLRPAETFVSSVSGAILRTCARCREVKGRSKAAHSDGVRHHSSPRPVPRATFPLPRNANYCPLDT